MSKSVKSYRSKSVNFILAFTAVWTAGLGIQMIVLLVSVRT
ncbi:hypothetical protein J32TS2_42190 [Shouchella clausii]|nr:hypothetical protein J32TS2_42190 [Shouchella clausii]